MYNVLVCDDREIVEAIEIYLSLIHIFHTAAGTGKRVGSSGSDPQPGGSGRYHGDYEGACERTKRCNPLLFVF